MNIEGKIIEKFDQFGSNYEILFRILSYSTIKLIIGNMTRIMREGNESKDRIIGKFE